MTEYFSSIDIKKFLNLLSKQKKKQLQFLKLILKKKTKADFKTLDLKDYSVQLVILILLGWLLLIPTVTMNLNGF